VQSITDAQLARLSQHGDRQAFGHLARRWDSRLFRFLNRLLGDEEEARDACQEAMLKAYQNIGRLRQPENFKAWLHQIALNLCRDRGRSAQVQPLVALDDDNEPEAVDPPAAAPTPLEHAERADLAAVLGQVLARLPLEQRGAILLREIQGFNSQEIATITGVPATTVRSRIFYGLRALRRMLPEYGVTETILEQGGTGT